MSDQDHFTAKWSGRIILRKWSSLEKSRNEFICFVVQGPLPHCGKLVSTRPWKTFFWTFPGNSCPEPVQNQMPHMLSNVFRKVSFPGTCIFWLGGSQGDVTSQGLSSLALAQQIFLPRFCVHKSGSGNLKHTSVQQWTCSRTVRIKMDQASSNMAIWIPIDTFWVCGSQFFALIVQNVQAWSKHGISHECRYGERWHHVIMWLGLPPVPLTAARNFWRASVAAAGDGLSVKLTNEWPHCSISKVATNEPRADSFCYMGPRGIFRSKPKRSQQVSYCRKRAWYRINDHGNWRIVRSFKGTNGRPRCEGDSVNRV